VLTSIAAALRELRCPPERVLEDGDLVDIRLGDPKSTAALLARCAAETRCEHFGLLVGQRLDPASLGLPALLLQAAPDVGTALRGLISHFGLQEPGAVFTLEVAEAFATLSYGIWAEAEGSRYVHDLSMVAACSVLRAWCGRSWRPSEVQLSRRRPGDLAPYRIFFRAPIRFDAQQSALAFASNWLMRRLPEGDFLVHALLESRAKALHAGRNQRLGHVLRAVVRQNLSHGRCTLAEAARQLGMHRRTLNRRLHAEGTTFHRELDGVRYAMAQQFLTETSMTLSEISAALGYSEGSALSRAFKRWSGTPPNKVSRTLPTSPDRKSSPGPSWPVPSGRDQ
jgi:AraC-like DNA-binding protein